MSRRRWFRNAKRNCTVLLTICPRKKLELRRQLPDISSKIHRVEEQIQRTLFHHRASAFASANCGSTSILRALKKDLKDIVFRIRSAAGSACARRQSTEVMVVRSDQIYVERDGDDLKNSGTPLHLRKSDGVDYRTHRRASRTTHRQESTAGRRPFAGRVACECDHPAACRCSVRA